VRPIQAIARLTSLTIACMVVVAAAGCSILLPSADSTSGRNPLQPIVPPRDAIELEVYLIDRVVGDPQIGDSLWNDLHAVTVVDPSVRDRLNQHGFRFAMSSSHPPQAIQSLLALSSVNDPSRRAIRQNFTVISGGDATLIANAIPPGSKVNIPMANGVRTLEIDQGNCLFQVRATRESNDWARIEIVPELRYGEFSQRYHATDHEFLMDHGQKSVKVYEDRLGLELNVGEFLVLGLKGDDKQALGRHYFRTELENREFERIILIRLARMSRIEPEKVERSKPAAPAKFTPL
jgi:hypothetical protein